MRIPEKAAVAVAGFVALIALLGLEGTWLMGDSRSAASEMRGLASYSCVRQVQQIG
jgi:hypothetical protein